MKISVIIPVYNEEKTIIRTIGKVTERMESSGDERELIIIDDGSIDNTLKLVNQIVAKNPNILVISHNKNIGRGKALRTGFSHATGDIIVTLDADLSYGVEHIPKLVSELKKDKTIDFVIGSPYMKGGRTIGVPFYRLLMSKMGNKLLSCSTSANLSTMTGILRAYRQYVINSLELESDGKEIHLEILSKAIAVGYKPKEIPAILRVRTKGKSKFKLKKTIISHLSFLFYEKPMILFGLGGIALIVIGLVSGLYLLKVWLKDPSTFNPERPLVTLTTLFVLTGILIFSFGFMASQIYILRKEMYKIQKRLKNLKEKQKNK
jgi:glycosyltransferase involved in cell wall biosynthesis